MLRVWQRHLGPDSAPSAPIPWFICTIIGLGASLCVITCLDHIAAETANGCCLYMDFPDDPTGNLHVLKDFMKDNFDICRWIGLTAVGLQGLSMLLAMILKVLGPHSETYYESDDDYVLDRVPLLKNYVPPHSYIVNDPLYQPKNDSWNIKINS